MAGNQSPGEREAAGPHGVLGGPAARPDDAAVPDGEANGGADIIIIPNFPKK